MKYVEDSLYSRIDDFVTRLAMERVNAFPNLIAAQEILDEEPDALPQNECKRGRWLDYSGKKSNSNQIHIL